MEDRIRITIGTVTYNAVKTLEDTIISVLSQTYSNIEYIIVDGNSSDGTKDLINKYSDRLSWISEPDNGVYDAMNKLCKIATGKYLLFLGADDTLCTNTVIQDFVEMIYTQQKHIYYGNAVFNSGKVYWGEFNKWKWGVSNICHQSIFYPHEVYQLYSYNLKYKVFADYAYNLFLLKNGFTFEYIPLNISNYRIDGYSSRVVDLEFNKVKYSLLRDTVGLLPVYFGILYRFMLHIKSFLVELLQHIK